jgi:hypothetical protein
MLLSSGIFKARVLYLLGKLKFKLNNNRKIIVVGYPRSGNTWVARLLGDVINSPVEGFWGDHYGNIVKRDDAIDGLYRKSKISIYKGHHTFENLRKNQKDIIFVVRDIRDIVISTSHFFKAFKNKSYGEIMLDLKKGCPGEIAPWCFPYNKYIDDYLENNVFILKYEDLLSDGIPEIKKILKHLKIEASDVKIQQSIDKHSVKNRKETEKSHIRLAKSNQYLEEMTPSEKVLADELFGGTLKKLKYFTV